MQIDPDAPITSRAEGRIDAPAEEVYDLLVEAVAWPSWHPHVSAVDVNGQLTPGTRFRWKANGLTITSSVEAARRPELVAWSGTVMGARALHVFHLADHGTSTHLVTEESLDGVPAKVMRGFLQRTVDEALEAWVRGLQQRVGR